MIEKGAPPAARPDRGLAETVEAFERFSRRRQGAALSAEQVRADLRGLTWLVDRVQLEVADRAASRPAARTSGSCTKVPTSG